MVDDSDLWTKIENHVSKFDVWFTFDDVVLGINRDPIVASFFIKDPIKQNIYELSQLAYLKTHGFPEVVRLNNGGKKSISIVDGEITPGPHKKDQMKSFDLKAGMTYFVCKYTKGSGGAQDNQYADVLKALACVREYLAKHPSSPHSFIFILDGSYYDDKVIILDKAEVRISISSCSKMKSTSL